MKSAKHFLCGMAMALPTLVLSSNDTVWISPSSIPGQELAQATCIVLKGNCAALEQPVYKILTQHPHPVTLIYENSPLNAPDFSVNLLTRVVGLKFIHCPNLDPEMTLMSFNKATELHELVLPVDLRQVPVRELTQFKDLQTLTLVDRYAKKARPSESLFYLEKGLWTETPLSVNIVRDEPLSMAEFRRFCEGLQRQQQPVPAFEPNYKTVKAPIPQLAIPYTGTLVDGEASTVLLTDRGSSLQIPENAFVDKYGQPVSGKVMVYFREMQNPMDCILSGIPMTYSTGGNRYDFETGGMFDIAASQNGEALALAPGKNIAVTMPTQDPTAFNFYAYNDNQGNWEELGKAPNIEKTSTSVSAPSVSNAVASYWRIYLNKSYRFYDTTQFADRFASPLYRNTTFQEKSDTRLRNVDIHRVKADEGKELKVTRLVKIGGMRKTKAGDVIFRVDNQHRIHPEFSSFNKNIRWKAENYANVADLRRAFNNSRKFSDIRLEGSGGSYVMHLKLDTMMITLNVSPLQLDRNHHLNAIDGKKNSQMDTRYYRSLAREERIFNRKLRIRKKKNDENRITIRDSVLRRQYAYHEVYAEMNADEKQLSKEAWERYAQEQKQYLASSSTDLSGNLYRTFTVNRLGIFNCDRIINQPKSDYLVKFVNEDKKPIAIATTYLLNSKINGVISSVMNPNGKVSLTVPRDGKTFLLCINTDNTLGFVSNDLLKTTLAGKSGAQLVSLQALLLPVDIFSRKDLNDLFSY